MVQYSSELPQSYSKRFRLWYTSYIFSNMGSGVLNPMIPIFISFYFSQSVIYVGIASSLSSLSSVIALILWGNISDNVRKRKIFVLIGFFGSFISLFSILFISTVTQYISVLIIYQFFAMASVPVSTLLIIENEIESEWSNTISAFSSISTIGTVLGLMGGFLFVYLFPSSTFILKIIYVTSSIIYLLSFCLAIFTLRESDRKIRRSSLSNLFSIRAFERGRYAPSYVIHVIKLFGSKKEAKMSGRLLRYLFISGFLMFAFQVFFTPYPVFLIDKYNSQEWEVYVMYILNSGLSAISFLYAGKYIKKASLEKSLYIPLFIRIVVFGGTSIIPMMDLYSSVFHVLVILIYGAMGFVWSFISIGQISLINRSSTPQNRGKAIGYYNSIIGVGQILGAFLSGFIVDYYGFSYTFILASALVLVGLSLIAIFNKRDKKIMNAMPQI
ncbi:MFS transporter [Caldiplasma sukawensis]